MCKRYETARTKGTFQTSDINKTKSITKNAMIHLKHYYGSISVRENILCVCVCVCD